ncbi:50S ribosomal protein L3 [Candidatus Woesearchaeota archaeon]|nr:50S ribosomal protein L3P [uncultured archaeon]MBS3153198.1 50S ribosomal protein L3 [Candidatus Woesearchaeota archaeon]
MPSTHKPRSGSLQYWPRKRSKKQTPRIRSWPKLDKTLLLGFPVYKVGMTHAQVKIQNPNSRLKNDLFVIPVTILECPSIKPFSLRFYKKTPYGLKAISEIVNKSLDKELARKIKLPKRKLEEKIPESYDDLRIICYTLPKNTGLKKKKPEIVEIGIGGKVEEKLAYAKSLFEKEIKINDIFGENQMVDIHGVTKGKGFQGTIKRFGLNLKQHKSEKKKRSTGNLGPVTPGKVLYSVPQAGKMGYHLRTELNKQILQIRNDPKEILPKEGFHRYGTIRGQYMLIKGSIFGPKKRIVILTHQMRKSKSYNYEVKQIKI